MTQPNRDANPRDAPYSQKRTPEENPESMSSNDNSAELMTAYLDAELGEEEVEEFERHLAESPEARAELEDLRKMMQLVRALPEVDAPSDFYEKVSRKLRRRAILDPDALASSAITLPFQVLSILVVLTAAALYMMAQLDDRPAAIEPVDDEASPSADAPRDVVP